MTTDPTLITGVGKRAGFHIARAFLLRGMPVIGTFRTRYGRLDELDHLGAELHRCDFNERSDVESLSSPDSENNASRLGLRCDRLAA